MESCTFCLECFVVVELLKFDVSTNRVDHGLNPRLGGALGKNNVGRPCRMNTEYTCLRDISEIKDGCRYVYRLHISGGCLYLLFPTNLEYCVLQLEECANIFLAG